MVDNNLWLHKADKFWNWDCLLWPSALSHWPNLTNNLWKSFTSFVVITNTHCTNSMFVYTDKMCVICVCCFPGPAVPSGYRPRFPDGGEGCLGKSAQRWRRRQFLRFGVQVAASFWSRDCIPWPAGSDRPGLSTDAGKTSRTSNNSRPDRDVFKCVVLFTPSVWHKVTFWFCFFLAALKHWPQWNTTPVPMRHRIIEVNRHGKWSQRNKLCVNPG